MFAAARWRAPELPTNAVVPRGPPAPHPTRQHTRPPAPSWRSKSAPSRVKPASGPSLIFKTMPVLFAQLPGGMLLASLFFILLAFAALTSAISMLEVVVAYVVDEDHLSRRNASMIAGGVIFLLGILSALSNSTLSGVKLLGDRNIFDTFDVLVSNVSLPVGGFAAAVFTGWLLSRQATDDEFEATGFEKGSRAFWRFCVRFVAPVAIIIVLLNSVGLIKLT